MGFGPKGDLAAVVAGSPMLRSFRTPGRVKTRWLSEDVPYGLGAWSALGKQLGVPTPTIDAVMELGTAILGQASRATWRTPADMGLAGLDRNEMLRYARTGQHA